MDYQTGDVRHPVPQAVRRLDITLKAALAFMLAVVVISPEWAHLDGKAAHLRALTYPVLAFTVPIIWFTCWRERASFPWLADLLVTVTCFSDILGNRLDLYDRISWFDDWMHFMNVGLLAAAVVLLTMHRTTGLLAVLERSLALGSTAAIGWEIAEYFAFISGSSERRFAYADTLGDLGLGVLGAVVAAVVVHLLWRRGGLSETAPQLELAYSVSARG
jgi:hypothetical protein